MQDDEFEWDDAKAAINVARHGVKFDIARLAFRDPFAVDREDRREDYGEERHTIIAMIDGRIVLVAYTFRAHRIRIIMARLAEPFERRLYHEANRST